MLSHRNLAAMAIGYLGGHRFPLPRRLSLSISRRSRTRRGCSACRISPRRRIRSCPRAEDSTRPKSRIFSRFIARRRCSRRRLGFAVSFAIQAFASAKIENIRTLLLGAAPVYAADLKAGHQVLGPRLWNGYGQGESPCTITAMPKALLAFGDRGRRRAPDGFRRPRANGNRSRDRRRRGPASPGRARSARSSCAATRSWPATGTCPRRPPQRCGPGWLHTGDLGALDDRGFLTLLDRAKDLIISGGSNIYPREIEDVLLEDPKRRRSRGDRVARSRMGRERRGRPRRGATAIRSISAASKPLSRSHRPIQAAEALADRRQPAEKQRRQGAEAGAAGALRRAGRRDAPDRIVRQECPNIC